MLKNAWWATEKLSVSAWVIAKATGMIRPTRATVTVTMRRLMNRSTIITTSAKGVGLDLALADKSQLELKLDLWKNTPYPWQAQGPDSIYARRVALTP